MSNPSKRKGSAFEVAVVEFLNAGGLPLVERRVTRGPKDAGDVAGIPGWALELKATRLINLASAIDEARVEAKNAGVPNFAAIIKRRRKGVSQAYFVMTLESARPLLASGGPS